MLKNVCYLLLITTLQSCLSDKKLAIRCAEKFPITSDTIFQKGKIQVTRIDTTIFLPNIIKNVVAYECPKSDTPKIVTIPIETVCPPAMTIEKTITTTDTITIKAENTARLQVAQDTIAQLTKAVEQQTKRKNIWKWIAVGSLVLNTLFILFAAYVWKHNH